MLGPILRGQKVTLRPPTPEDAPHFVRWLADPEVTRYLGVRSAPTLEQEQEWIKRKSEDRNCVLWAIEVEGTVVGTIEILNIDWLNAHGSTGTLVGDKARWRQGIAGEAMALRTRYAFRELNLHKLKTYVWMENEASKRALAKCGYREVGVLKEDQYRDGRRHDAWLAEVHREDWEREKEAARPSAGQAGVA